MGYLLDSIQRLQNVLNIFRPNTNLINNPMVTLSAINNNIILGQYLQAIVNLHQAFEKMSITPEWNDEFTRNMFLNLWDTICSIILEKSKMLHVTIFEQFSILTTKYVH